jgi:hypothetical protein
VAYFFFGGLFGFQSPAILPALFASCAWVSTLPGFTYFSPCRKQQQNLLGAGPRQRKRLQRLVCAHLIESLELVEIAVLRGLRSINSTHGRRLSVKLL